MGVFLIANWQRRAHPNVGSATSRQAGPGCLRKKAEPWTWEQAGKQPSPGPALTALSDEFVTLTLEV